MVLHKLLRSSANKRNSDSPDNGLFANFPHATNETNPNKVEFYYVNYDLSKFEQHIQAIKELLDIEIPEMHVVPHMADYNDNHILLDKKPEDAGVPVECSVWGYLNDDGSIHIGAFHPMTGELNTDAIILTTIAHELRHVWQKTYEYNTYYKKNAFSGIDCINDISEIDADAFAMAYMKNRTSYPASEYMEQLNVYMSFDRGARKNRSRIIRNKYFN